MSEPTSRSITVPISHFYSSATLADFTASEIGYCYVAQKLHVYF